MLPRNLDQRITRGHIHQIRSVTKASAKSSYPALGSTMDAIRKSALAKPLAAHEQAEMLAKKRGGSAVEKFLVRPDYAYPNTRMNRDELRAEMNKPSAFFHDLRRDNNEIGLLKLEILQCIGLPRLDALGENDTFCLAVCGSYAFQTDISPPNQNPMWLSKMRRACIFPLYHAYARLYVGVFDDDGENERDDFAGRVVLDVARMRPGCTYDVTLPLRQSAHVYMKRPRGAVRVRFHVSWYNERAAMLSYLPKGAPKFEPHESVTVNCCDKKSFQNVALTVHGTHPPGRFSMKLVRALVREINFTRIHVLRYLRKQEIRNLVGWKNPIISGFVFCSWMHSVYANTVRYVPGNVITLLLLYLWRNYGNYAISESRHRGFLPPTWEEMLLALIYGTDGRNCIQPLEMTLNEDVGPPLVIDGGGGSICCSGGCTLDEVAAAFKKGVKVSTKRYRLRIYRQTFAGNEAVDFLVNSGYASSREEAVKIGLWLEKDKKLFEHVHRKHEFKDSRLFYHFLICDDSKYTYTTHEPMGKPLLRMAGFLDDNRSFSEDQLEMPYSNGNDHPRFSVKESLVIRSKGSQRRMEKLMSESDDEEDAADLDMNVFDSSVDQRRLDKFDSYFDLKTAPSSPILPSEDLEDGEENTDDDSLVTVKVLKKPPLQDIDYKPKSDRPISDLLAEARYKVHGLLLHCFNDRLYVVKNKEEPNQTSPTAKESFPVASQRGMLLPSGDSSQRTTKSDFKRNRWMNRTSEEGLVSIPESDGRDLPGSRRFFSQKIGSGTNKSPSGRSPKSETEITKEENDKLLKTGSYSNTNRWVAKLGVIVQ